MISTKEQIQQSRPKILVRCGDSAGHGLCPVEPSVGNRLRQLQRVFLIIELLAPLRHGATTAEIARDVRDDLGTYCERTVRRDLQALAEIGLIKQVAPRHRWRSHGDDSAVRWRWVDRSIRGAILHKAAELQSMAGGVK